MRRARCGSGSHGHQQVLPLRIADRVTETLLDRERADLAAFVHRQKAHLQRARKLGLAPHQPHHHLAAGLRWRLSLAHHFHHRKAAYIANHFFAHTGGGGAAHVVIYIQPRSDDGAVADPAVHLPRHATGGARAGQIAVRIECQHADGVVVVLATRQLGIAPGAVLDIGFGRIPGRLQPFLPRRFRSGRQQLGLGEPLLKRELPRTIAHQHHVRRFFHHRARHRDGVHHIFQRSHRTAIAEVIHDAGIQSHPPVAIRIATQAHGGIAGIGLGHAHARFNRIQRLAAGFQNVPGRLIGGDAEIPGGDHPRRASGQDRHTCGASRTRSCLRPRAPPGQPGGNGAQRGALEEVTTLDHPDALRDGNR